MRNNEITAREDNHYFRHFGFLGLLLFCFLGYNFLVSGSTILVEGVSMNPTLADGDLLQIDRSVQTVNRDDIVILRRDHTNYVKRIIAVPGDTLTIADGKLYLNGVFSESVEPISPAITDVRTDYPLSLHEGQYFVMGDNRSNSWDSRSLSFGLVDRSEIYALVTGYAEGSNLPERSYP